jgi:6-phosphogluconolactonase
MNPHDRDLEVEIFEDLEALSQAAADLFVTMAKRSIDADRKFTVALAGGGTPRRTYELLASPKRRDAVQWQAVHVFWGDERCVPPDDPRSNARMARLALLDRVPIPADQVHPMACKDDPSESAADYEAVLRTCFGGTLPRLDLILLGMGEDGHTASLFPGTAVLDEVHAWAAAVPSKDPPRVTLTYPVLDNARVIAFLVSGRAKADALHRVIDGTTVGDAPPASLVRPTHGTRRFLVDRDAARMLASRR